MPTDNIRNGSSYPRDSPRVLQLADRRVIEVVVLLELMMSIKGHIPAKPFELIDKASFD
jgi:hypothetical protein